MVSLLALTCYSLAMTFGVYGMLSSSYGYGGLQGFFATAFLVALGTLATLCAVIAGLLQLRRARPKLIRLTALLTASFYCSLFLFFWICFLIVDVKGILPGPYVAEQNAIMGQVLLKSLFILSVLMVFPLLRNRYKQSQPS